MQRNWIKTGALTAVAALMICEITAQTAVTPQPPSAGNAPKFKGQEPIKKVSTTSRPVELQERKTFSFAEDGISFSNQFEGAHFNGVKRIAQYQYEFQINPENSPVNGSPWYAFKVWSGKKDLIRFRFLYAGRTAHRYEPKFSNDGKTWKTLPAETDSLERGSSRWYNLETGKDTIWVAAQDLVTTSTVSKWITALQTKNGVKPFSVGRSTLGRSIDAFSFGNPDSKAYFLILGRQHPPEVTGHKALESFTEALLADNADAKRFREKFRVITIPLLNPDGVDEGFWRHNAGGVDLNRDWEEFNQPETRAVRDYLKKEITDGKKLYSAIDFHSTYDDIYYIVDPKKTGIVPGLVTKWLNALQENIPGYSPNIKPLYFEPPAVTSFSYLFETYGTEALVFEIGDKTDPDFIKKKGQVAAATLAKLMNNISQ